MQIHLKLLANYKEYFPKGTTQSQITLDVLVNSTPEAILSEYRIPLAPESVVLVNGITPEEGVYLQEGDVLCAFPAMAGG